MQYDIASSALNSLLANIVVLLGFGVSLIFSRRPADIVNRRGT